ncbi:MAG: hypothetical protein WAV38_17100 [Xanthobacteraceae bacterium]|jgi:hypothetical protein
MSLKHIVELLIKDSEPTSRFLRALRLFEFQVSVFYRKSFDLLVASESNVTAPTAKLKKAQILAAIKILEKIEADLKQKQNLSVISIRELAADENYQSIFDDVIVTNGGWSRIIQSISARAFDKNIAARCSEAETAVNIVDFSYRFSKHPASTRNTRRKNPGGVDSAKYVVRKAYKPIAGGESVVKKRWRKYSSPAIFLYLMLTQKFDLQPPQINSTEFVDKLLKQADNIDELRRYFCAYQTVHAALLDQKYKFPELNLDLGCSPLELNAAELSSDIKAAFDDWLKRD